MSCERIDISILTNENAEMMTTTESLTIDEADERAVLDHAFHGKPMDPEVRRRVRERSEKLTKALRLKYGEMNIANDLIRETRDE